jgi:hypothetical protein
MKFKFLLVILILLICGFLFWFTAIFRFPLERRKIKVLDKELIVWVADTSEARLKGLQNIIWMPKNRGMLFVFETPDKYCFWNKNTLMPLKLVFMRDGYVTEEIELNSIWKGKQTVCPRYEADSVLEIINH